MTDIIYICILSRISLLENIKNNSKYFKKTIIFNNTKEVIKLPNIDVIDIFQKTNQNQISSFSYLRNLCLSFLELNKYYIFLDDDDIIIKIPLNLEKIINQNDYYSIRINNYYSNIRIFKMKQNLKYINDVHEVLNVDLKQNKCIDFEIIHIPFDTGNLKLEWYHSMLNKEQKLYYSIRDSVINNTKIYLTQEEYNQLLQKNKFLELTLINLSYKLLKYDSKINIHKKDTFELIQKNIHNKWDKLFVMYIFNKYNKNLEEVFENQNIFIDKLKLFLHKET